MQVESSEGVLLAVHTLADPGGTAPTLLFSHGNGMHSHTWLQVALELADDFRCLGVDFRAHGYTQTPAEISLGWEDMRDDLLAAADALSQAGVEVAGLAGHSLGGAVAVHALLARPGQFAKAWAYEPVLPVFDAAHDTAASELERTSGNVLAEGARRRKAVFASRQAAYDRFSQRPPLGNFTSAALWDYLEHGLADLPSGEVALRCAPEHEARIFEEVIEASPEALAQVEAPVAVVVGGDDSPPVKFGRLAASAMPQAQLTCFEQLGHFGPMQDPALIAAHIRGWFS